MFTYAVKLRPQEKVYFLFAARNNTKIFPEIQTAHLGESAIFTCLSADDVDWFFERGTLPTNAITYKRGYRYHLLRIDNVKLSNAGSYFCYGMNGQFDTLESVYDNQDNKAILTVIGELIHCK